MRDRRLNDVPVGTGPVLYWMTSQRRLEWNHALDHAVARADELETGIVILEALRADYPFASKRLHTFIRQGMEEHAKQCDEAGVAYHGHIEPTPGTGRGLLAEYSKHVSLIVADDHPGFFFPRMLAGAAKLPVRVEAVDSVGILPMAAAKKPFASAYQFRRFVQKNLEEHLQPPQRKPLDRAPPADDPVDGWREMELPDFDTDVPEASAHGGRKAALERLASLLENLYRYPERNHPDANAQSGLSPYLHFGHIGVSEAVARVLEKESWNPGMLGAPKGQRAGWWGLSEGAEAFLDQVITWRELGHVEARFNTAYREYNSLPEWAKETLAQHESDRVAPYTLDALERAGTDDEVWNAAQRQLLEEGSIQNYLRMLWGKKILEWAPSAEAAVEWMFYLNDKYALDGRDPNSVSGIMWCLGRYDRPWQERAIFGKVRCMKSANTKRKLRMREYLARWSPDEQLS